MEQMKNENQSLNETGKDAGQEYEKAVEYIYDRVKDGTFRMGDKLPTERAIAEELNISRNSTRQALSMFHGMGLINSVQGSGNYIAKDSSKALQNIIRMMLALNSVSRVDISNFRRRMEKDICLWAIELGVDEAWSKKVKKILIEMDKAQDCMLADIDKQFHKALLESTQNNFCILLMDAVTNVYGDWIEEVLDKSGKGRKAEFIHIHYEMYYAIITQDRERCENAINRHYDLVEQVR